MAMIYFLMNSGVSVYGGRKYIRRRPVVKSQAGGLVITPSRFHFV